MANKFKGEITIRLDKTRTLKFGFATFARFEKQSGKSMQNAFSDREDVGMQSFYVIADMLWASMAYGDDKNITPEEVLELVDFADGENELEKSQYIQKIVMEGMASSQGPENQKKMQVALSEIGDPSNGESLSQQD